MRLLTTTIAAFAIVAFAAPAAHAEGTGFGFTEPECVYGQEAPPTSWYRQSIGRFYQCETVNVRTVAISTTSTCSDPLFPGKCEPTMHVNYWLIGPTIGEGGFVLNVCETERFCKTRAAMFTAGSNTYCDEGQPAGPCGKTIDYYQRTAAGEYGTFPLSWDTTYCVSVVPMVKEGFVPSGDDACTVTPTRPGSAPLHAAHKR